MKNIIKIISAAWIMCGLMACNACNDSKGILRLSIKTDNAIRTVSPNMNIVNYRITGDGDGDESFDMTTTETSIDINVMSGTWNIEIRGLNEDDIILCEGTGSTEVIANRVSELSITIIPLAGIGSIQANITWNNQTTRPLQVSGKLIDKENEETYLDFDVNQEERTAAASLDIMSGYYLFVVVILIDGNATGGGVESVRILRGVETIVSMNINLMLGGLKIIISTDYQNPLNISILDMPDEITRGTDVTITADTEEGATIDWFINGEKKGSGQSFVFGSSLFPGSYRLDVCAFHGVRGGGTTRLFDVVQSEAILAPTELRAVAVSHDQIDLGWKYADLESIEGFDIYRTQTPCNGYVTIIRLDNDGMEIARWMEEI